jgi:hypothetical protein
MPPESLTASRAFRVASPVREKKGHPNGFRTQAASAAILIAATSMLGASHAPAPPTAPVVTYRDTYRLVAFDSDGWTCGIVLSGSDGSERPMGTVTCPNGWTDAGMSWLFDMLTGTEEAPMPSAMTPAQKLKQLKDEGVAQCCGTVTSPPCPNYCGCNNSVETLPDGTAGSTSSFCVCKSTAVGGKCPAGWTSWID